MLKPDKSQVDKMKLAIGELMAGGDSAFAKAWLLWAEVYLHTIDVHGPPMASTEKILPLAFWLNKTTGAEVGVVQRAIHDSLTRILFQSRLKGRDLNADDGHTALQVIRSGLRKGD